MVKKKSILTQHCVVRFFRLILRLLLYIIINEIKEGKRISYGVVSESRVSYYILQPHV